MTHICVVELTIGSDNDLSPGRRQAIFWTNAGVLLIRPSRTNFSGILIKIYAFSFNNVPSKMSSGKCGPFCPGLNVLIAIYRGYGLHLMGKMIDQCRSVHPFVNIICIYTLRPRQDGWHFADNIFRCIFLNENFCITIWISLKLVLEGLFDNKSALVEIMAWHQTDNNVDEAMLSKSYWATFN